MCAPYGHPPQTQHGPRNQRDVLQLQLQAHITAGVGGYLPFTLLKGKTKKAYVYM